MPHKSALPAVWASMYAALNVAAITTTLECPVYDHVPQAPTFPYLRMGSATENRQDTFGKAGKVCRVEVHIFTSAEDYEGAGQAQAILSAVIGVLHYEPLTIAGHELLACQVRGRVRRRRRRDRGCDDQALRGAVPVPGARDMTREHELRVVKALEAIAAALTADTAAPACGHPVEARVDSSTMGHPRWLCSVELGGCGFTVGMEDE